MRDSDPRLAEFMEGLRKTYRDSGIEGGSPETQFLDKETFTK